MGTARRTTAQRSAGSRDKMPQGKSAMVKNVTSKSAIQKKQNNQKLKAKKLKKAAKKGGARVGGTTDQKSAMFQQRAGDKDDVEAVELTKQINRRISEDLHSKAAKRGSGYAVVKSTDFES